MELSVDQLEAILAHVTGVDRDSRPDEQRRAARVTLRADLSIISCTPGELAAPQQVMVRDISCRGVGFTHAQPLEPGQQFILFIAREGRRPLTVLCTVAHCHRAGTDRFAIGAEFATGLVAEEGAADKGETERIRASMLG